MEVDLNESSRVSAPRIFEFTIADAEGNVFGLKANGVAVDQQHR